MKTIESLFFRLVTILLVLCFLTACKEELHTGLQETDANEIIAKLINNGISATKLREKAGDTVLVEARDFAAAVDILRTHGLPRRRFDSVNDVFNSEGLVASPLQEWARLNYAMSQELSESISAIPGVVRADVHLGQTHRESPFEEVEPPSASVMIQIDEDMITENLVPEVKQIVALAHPDIQFDRVGVVVTPVQLQTEEIPFSEVGGIVVHERDAPMVRYLVSLAAGMTFLSVTMSIVSFILWRKQKVGAK